MVVVIIIMIVISIVMASSVSESSNNLNYPSCFLQAKLHYIFFVRIIRKLVTMLNMYNSEVCPRRWKINISLYTRKVKLKNNFQIRLLNIKCLYRPKVRFKLVIFFSPSHII